MQRPALENNPWSTFIQIGLGIKRLGIYFELLRLMPNISEFAAPSFLIFVKKNCTKSHTTQSWELACYKLLEVFNQVKRHRDEGFCFSISLYWSTFGGILFYAPQSFITIVYLIVSYSYTTLPMNTIKAHHLFFCIPSV